MKKLTVFIFLILFTNLCLFINTAPAAEKRRLSLEQLEAEHSKALRYYRKKNRDMMLKTTRNALNYKPWIINQKTVEYYNNFGFFLEQGGYTNEAVDVLKEVIRHFPNRIPAYLNIGDAYAKQYKELQRGLEDAYKNYNIYADLMKKAGKQKKIPKRITKLLNISEFHKNMAKEAADLMRKRLKQQDSLNTIYFFPDFCTLKMRLAYAAGEDSFKIPLSKVRMESEEDGVGFTCDNANKHCIGVDSMSAGYFERNSASYYVHKDENEHKKLVKKLSKIQNLCKAQPAETKKSVNASLIPKTWKQLSAIDCGSAVCTYGLKSIAEKLQSLVSYKSLVELSGLNPFKSGPHGTTYLNLNNTSRFGHYNPQFVHWLIDNLIPGAKSETFRKATQTDYNKYLKNLARTYYVTHQKLMQKPAYLSHALEKYKETIKNSFPYDLYSNDEFCREFTKEYDDSVLRFSVAFWLRREMDGTRKEFVKGLTKLIKTYDRDFYKQNVLE